MVPSPAAVHPAVDTRRRLVDVDTARGLAILLVVFGHVVMREPPTGNGWYLWTRSAIYSFHMPLFMYLTGIVFFLTGAAVTAPSRYPRFLAQRALRFLVPFVVMGLLIVFGKAVAGQFVQVDNNSLGLREGLTSLLWHTSDSPALSLWYIFVVFVFCIVIPPLMWLSIRVFRARLMPLIVLAAVLYVLPVPEYVYLDRVARFMIFFVLGGVLTHRWPRSGDEQAPVIRAPLYDRYVTIIDRWRWPLVAVFLGTVVLTTELSRDSVTSLAICGLLSLPAVHALCRARPVCGLPLLLFVGGYSFAIYLFNTIAIGVTKGVMFKVIDWNGPNFMLFVPALFLAGLVGPILLKRVVLSRNAVLDRMTT